MSRKPYTVENQRPRRTVNLYGNVLAPKGRGRTSMVDLDLDEVLGAPCIRNLAIGRLKVVRGDMAPLDARLAELLSDEEEDTSASATPAPAPVTPPVEEKEAEVVEEPPVSEEPEGDASSEAPAEDESDSESWTLEALEALSYRKLQKAAKAMDLSASGAKEEIIERILDAQESA